MRGRAFDTLRVRLHVVFRVVPEQNQPASFQHARALARDAPERVRVQRGEEKHPRDGVD